MPYKSKADAKACRIRNRPAQLKYMRGYLETHREENKQRCAKWYRDNRAEVVAEQTAYAKAHPEVNKAASKKYREKNQSNPEWRAKKAAWARNKRAANPEKANAYSREYAKQRYANNPEFKIICRLRARLYKKIRATGGTKFASALDLTGCTTEFLRGYIEGLFRDGMNWNNIHIDHIVPIAAFDLTNEDDQRKCFHYSNLQPLFGAENMVKGAKWQPEPSEPH